MLDKTEQRFRRQDLDSQNRSQTNWARLCIGNTIRPEKVTGLVNMRTVKEPPYDWSQDNDPLVADSERSQTDTLPAGLAQLALVDDVHVA